MESELKIEVLYISPNDPEPGHGRELIWLPIKLADLRPSNVFRLWKDGEWSPLLCVTGMPMPVIKEGKTITVIPNEPYEFPL